MPGMVAWPALLILLLGLAAALVALWRLHRDIHAPIRRMLDAMPPDARDQSAQDTGPRADLRRLEDAFDEMRARLDAQTATLDQACELAGLGTWAILPDLESVRASAHIRDMLGFSQDNDVVQLDALRARILPGDRAAFDAALERAANERRLTRVEFRARDADGEVRIFRARTGPDGAVPRGPAQGISGIIQDITEFRHAEDALTRSNRLERLAGEAARVGGWRYEIATRMFTGTPETARLVGLEDTWNSSIEDAMDRLVTGKERAQMERSFWTCVGTGTRFDEIAKFNKFDGEDIWLRVIGEAERDAGGDIVGAWGATQDVSDLVRARTTTEEIRALLQTILNDLSDGFIIHTPDGEIRYMNPRAHSILGVPDGDLTGGNIWKDIPWIAGSQFGQVVADAMDSGESRTFEGEISLPDQWVNVMVHPTPAGIAIYLNDVTEDRAVRSQLRLLDAAIAQISEVVLITDASSPDMPGPQVVFVNEAFVSMTGYAKDDILGATPRILQGPETERARLQEIRAALEAQQPLRTELTNYRKDGSHFTAEIDINPLFNAAGDCTHFVSVQRDTTERRQNEEHLRLREEQFRLASRASQDIIWDWDMHTGIIWNSDNSRMFFQPPSEGSAENAREERIENTLERIHPDDRLEITESLDDALTGDAETWRCEYRVKAQDGTWRNMTDKAFIVRDDDGQPRRMVGAMSDVTEFRNLDARLHQAQKLETVGQLTGGIAHDFNNLITIILGNCDILLDDMGDNPALRPLLRSIEDAAERGARISSDLLAFSRRQPLEPHPTDINDLIRRSGSLFERALVAGIDLRYDLTDAPAIALVDPDKLQAALLNLVLNAAAAISNQGTITVRTRAESTMVNDRDFNCTPGEYVRVEIEDDGVGMSAEVAERAFEPFFTTKEAGVGTGMGLSSAYGLVKQSDGHASIVSKPDQGTTVRLSFPAVDAEEPGAQLAQTDRMPSRGGGHRILVVEDDSDLRSFVCRVLARKGYRIVEAETAAIALQLLETDDDFDLIFTDVVMPGGVSGAELARRTQMTNPRIKILFTSGYAWEVLAGERDVPDDIPMLYKPFRTNDLVEKVQVALSKGPARED